MTNRFMITSKVKSYIKKDPIKTKIKYPLIRQSKEDLGYVVCFYNLTSGIALSTLENYDSAVLEKVSNLPPHTNTAIWQPFNGSITINVQENS